MSKIADLPIVSIVIPCYNAGKFIKQTIDSIINQSYKQIEIIIVNDGSNDNSITLVEKINDDRIKFIHQINSGVSVARNNGLAIAKGHYVVFFDADDLMATDFLEKRIQLLEENNNIDFVCGYIASFCKEGEFMKNRLEGVYSNIENEVLFYNPNISTCPSNYMFRKNSLINNNLIFNSKLSSSADRYFLLEIAKRNLKGEFILQGGELYYRIHSNSMSHKLTLKLVNDAEMYYSELVKNKIIPTKIKRKVLSKGYYIISGSYFKLKKGKAILYAIKSFVYSPHIFFVNFIKLSNKSF